MWPQSVSGAVGSLGTLSSTALTGREKQSWQTCARCWPRRPDCLPDPGMEYVENFIDSVLTQIKV